MPGWAAAALGLAATLGLLVAAPPAGAARRAEKPPDPKACVHNNPSLPRPTAAQIARPTWPQQILQYSRAWAFARGAGVTVAVVDSGVDASHEQLAGHVANGWDVTGITTRRGGTTDCSGHGTAVAGIIAAQPMPGRGMAGVAPDATIVPVRETWGIDDNGQPTTATAEALLRAMRVAVDSGATVVNVSITVPDTQLREDQRQAFNRLAQDASNRDVLIVAASGNKSQYTQLRDRQFATYPAKLASWYHNVIAVSGVTSDGKVDTDAVTGPFVTVAAPDRGFLSTFEHGGLIAVNGTSFAAPIVSGLAALLRSRFPQDSAPEVRARIEATADHPSTDLPDPQVGYGVVDPPAALTTVLPPTSTPVPTAARSGPLAVVTDPDARLKVSALLTAVAALLVVGLLVFSAGAVRRGRRRGWRPGTRPPPATVSGQRNPLSVPGGSPNR